MLTAIFGVVIFVLDIVAIVDAIGRRGDTVKKALWIGLIIVLPIVGMVCYFLFGRSGEGQLS